jgi:phytoene dehydrogenase-like protein
MAHPLPNGQVATLHKSTDATAAELGEDGKAWVDLMRPFARREFIESLLGPVWFDWSSLSRKLRFGLLGLRSCDSIVRNRFAGVKARALFGGCAGHSILALDRPGTASFGLMLALSAHVAGWPIIEGGSQQITNALVRRFTECGGVLQTNHRVTSLAELPPAKAILFDLSPRQVASICGETLPARYRARLSRFEHGPGIFKVDLGMDPFRGRIPNAHAPAPFTSAGHTKKSSTPKRKSPAESRPKNRSCFLRNNQFSTARAASRANTLAGRIATCRMGAQKT